MINNAALPTRADSANRSTLHRKRALLFIARLALMVGSTLAVVTAAHGQTDARTQQQMPPTPTDIKPGSITLEDLPYPYPVSYLPLTLYGQDVRMAYMDVAPSAQPNGRTVVLFHGMNFFGEYWAATIDVLRKQ